MNINRARWSKGQHRLPEELVGWTIDLNKDNVGEFIIETGQAVGDHLILQIVGERVVIIGTFRGSFGLIRTPEGWDDIVEFSSGSTYYRAKTCLRFDGTSYKPVWRYEQADENSEPGKIDLTAPR